MFRHLWFRWNSDCRSGASLDPAYSYLSRKTKPV